MIVVVDASAAVKLVLDEDDSDLVRRLWDRPLALVAPATLPPEVAAAIEAAHRATRLTAAQCRRAHTSWDLLTAEVDLAAVDAALAVRASTVAIASAVRGMDAIYIALARQLAERTTVGVLSFDNRQRAAIDGLSDVVLLPAEVPPTRDRGGAAQSGVHHLELWLPDLRRVERSLGWLLGELGWSEFQRWPEGVSWRRGSTYVVVEQSPDLRPGRYERTAPGLNHLALHAGSQSVVDAVVLQGPSHGWRLLFHDVHPYAGGPEHYAAYLEDGNGLEVELVATAEKG